MPRESGQKEQRINISYFEGVNSTVQQGIARRTELEHMENARAPVIGVLEKREGQVAVGTNSDGGVFTALGNYGLVFFADEVAERNGLLRVTTVSGSVANIYLLNSDDEWIIVDNALAQNLSLSTCDFAKVDSNLVVVNGNDDNIMFSGVIGDEGTATMVSGATAGSLYNSPVANKVAFYKSRIYLADYYTDAGEELKTTVLRSSYPMGIISLLNSDVSAAVSGTWTLPVVDIKYFYATSGMNVYEIYRGNTKIATITISSITETSIVASNSNVTFESGYSSFLSSDEVWIYGTFTGEKQYRWISNSSSIGRDVKQYDTFKLVGGDESAITLFEPIGNILMIANKNAMMTWNDYTLENFDIGVGCSSKNGYVKLKGALYFLHYSGIYSTSGGIPQLLSRKVERYIKGATKAGLEAAAAGFKGLSVFFAIGDVTLYNPDGSTWKTLSDVCLEFNVADQNWYVHTNVTSTQFETYVATSGAEKLVMNSVTPGSAQVVGAELITNGGFVGGSTGWSVGEGWSYGSGKMTFRAP